jgi:hypothetical protein
MLAAVEDSPGCECRNFTKRIKRFLDYFKVFEAEKPTFNEMKRIKNE